MTRSQNPRIDISPAKIYRLAKDRDFDLFVRSNIPDKRAKQLRKAFELIWIAHRVFPAIYPGKSNDGGLRTAHYKNFKTHLEKKMSSEAGQEVRIDIPVTALEKALRKMRAAGYMRYIPLEDKWYFTKRCSNALRLLADLIDDFQGAAPDTRTADKIIHDFTFGLGTVSEESP